MSTTSVSRGRTAFAALLFSLSPLLAIGCGGDGERTSNPRPPKAINIAVKIGDDEVDVSPPRFGAGPIVLQASNQSSASHRLTLEGPRVKQTLGPINPQDTATLKVTMTPGEYSLSADGSAGVQPATLRVGTQRPSAQNELLQP